MTTHPSSSPTDRTRSVGTTVTGPADPTPQAVAVSRAVEGRELLTHPFYRRWEAGTLDPAELSEYAVEYRAFEAALPTVLTAVAGRLREAGAAGPAALVERNLADELGSPESHLALFDRFASAVGAIPAPPGAAATALVTTYLDLVAEGPAAALAGLAAYESQSAAIAASKADGLRRWYGTDPAGTAFWDVHAAMDDDHATWATDALAALDASPAEVSAAAGRAAEAWWALLDERQDAAGDSAQLCTHH
jgi:pyrroloquinoline quinone (PQQ) biosynthesis protein C